MPTAPVATFGMGRVDPLKGPQKALVEDINLAPSTVYPAGTILGEVTATPGTYAPYSNGNLPVGTSSPTHILQWACVTDALGNITFGAGPAGTAEWSQTYKGAPAYTSGEFSCADLVGLDAPAVPKLGRLLQGTIAAGRILIYGA